MADDLISGNSLLRAAEAVRAKREAQRTSTVAEPKPLQITTTAQIRARLNVFPDDATLASMIDRGLAALSRGIRWARGSIINLVV